MSGGLEPATQSISANASTLVPPNFPEQWADAGNRACGSLNHSLCCAFDRLACNFSARL